MYDTPIRYEGRRIILPDDPKLSLEQIVEVLRYRNNRFFWWIRYRLFWGIVQ